MQPSLVSLPRAKVLYLSLHSTAFTLSSSPLLCLDTWISCLAFFNVFFTLFYFFRYCSKSLPSFCLASFVARSSSSSPLSKLLSFSFLLSAFHSLSSYSQPLPSVPISFSFLSIYLSSIIASFVLLLFLVFAFAFVYFHFFSFVFLLWLSLHLCLLSSCFLFCSSSSSPSHFFPPFFLLTPPSWFFFMLVFVAFHFPFLLFNLIFIHVCIWHPSLFSLYRLRPCLLSSYYFPIFLIDFIFIYVSLNLIVHTLHIFAFFSAFHFIFSSSSSILFIVLFSFAPPPFASPPPPPQLLTLPPPSL